MVHRTMGIDPEKIRGGKRLNRKKEIIKCINDLMSTVIIHMNLIIAKRGNQQNGGEKK